VSFPGDFSGRSQDISIPSIGRLSGALRIGTRNIDSPFLCAAHFTISNQVNGFMPRQRPGADMKSKRSFASGTRLWCRRGRPLGSAH
jgi:hypothetical protein